MTTGALVSILLIATGHDLALVMFHNSLSYVNLDRPFHQVGDGVEEIEETGKRGGDKKVVVVEWPGMGVVGGWRELQM